MYNRTKNLFFKCSKFFIKSTEEIKLKQNQRFNVKYSQSSFSNGKIQIIVDNETGVNYIMTIGFGFSGITPLINSDGSICVDNNSNEKDN